MRAKETERMRPLAVGHIHRQCIPALSWRCCTLKNRCQYIHYMAINGRGATVKKCLHSELSSLSNEKNSQCTLIILCIWRRTPSFGASTYWFKWPPIPKGFLISQGPVYFMGKTACHCVRVSAVKYVNVLQRGVSWGVGSIYLPPRFCLVEPLLWEVTGYGNDEAKLCRSICDLTD